MWNRALLWSIGASCAGVADPSVAVGVHCANFCCFIVSPKVASWEVLAGPLAVAYGVVKDYVDWLASASAGVEAVSASLQMWRHILTSNLLAKLISMLARLPSFPQLFGIQVHCSPQLVSILVHVDDWVQVLLMRSKDMYAQPSVEFRQEFLHSQMSLATKTSKAVPLHFPGFEQSTQSRQSVKVNVLIKVIRF